MPDASLVEVKLEAIGIEMLALVDVLDAVTSIAVTSPTVTIGPVFENALITGLIESTFVFEPALVGVYVEPQICTVASQVVSLNLTNPNELLVASPIPIVDVSWEPPANSAIGTLNFRVNLSLVAEAAVPTTGISILIELLLS